MVPALHRLKLCDLIQFLLLHIDKQPLCYVFADGVDARQARLESGHTVVGEVAVLARLLAEELQGVLVGNPVELGHAGHDAPVQRADAISEEAALLSVQGGQHLRTQ